MAIIHKTSQQVLQLNAVMLALFVFGPGLTPPEQYSSPGPASTCAAPYFYYQQVALLHHLFLFSIVASCAAAIHVQSAVAGEEGQSIAAMGAAAKLRTRVVLLLAIGFSLAAAGLAIGVYSYVLQIFYTIFACMPSGVRLAVFAADAVVAVVSVYTYSFFVRAAITGV